MITHYGDNGSATGAWQAMSINLLTDKGHNLEFRNGRVILDGVASVDSWASARELIVNEFDACPARRIDGEVDPYLA